MFLIKYKHNAGLSREPFFSYFHTDSDILFSMYETSFHVDNRKKVLTEDCICIPHNNFLCYK